MRFEFDEFDELASLKVVGVGVMVFVGVGIAVVDVAVGVGVAVSSSIIVGQGNASITPGSLQKKHPRLKDQTDAGGTEYVSSE